MELDSIKACKLYESAIDALQKLSQATDSQGRAKTIRGKIEVKIEVKIEMKYFKKGKRRGNCVFEKIRTF